MTPEQLRDLRAWVDDEDVCVNSRVLEWICLLLAESLHKTGLSPIESEQKSKGPAAANSEASTESHEEAEDIT